MLYDAEGNIGQVKRDLKLVCAKSFLHYRMHQEEKLVIRKEELSLQVQKGLLRIKEVPERLDRFMDSKSQYLTFEPGFADVVWSRDPERNMQVYNDIEEKVMSLSESGRENIDLESLISKDVDEYFQTYVKELTKSTIPKDLIPEDIWRLTNELYDLAEQRLDRIYNQKARFAFALHLQSTLDRVKDGHMIVHPDLNNIRKKFKKEFQVAIDLSTIIEEDQQVEIPFDEIGFISMFLSINLGESEPVKENKVDVLVLMHGRQTASSMLEMAQDLLGTTIGQAFNMPLEMEVQSMYEEVLRYVKNRQSSLINGLILLTDMGSLNTFSDLIYEETGIRTKAITMTSTMIVIEAIRMANVGRSLEDIYQSIQMSFESIVKDQFKIENQEQLERKKAVIVTCFTGEGVAAKLYQRIVPVINQDKVEVIQMQFLERESFKRHIDALLEEYEIKAIAGTVEVDYQNIPFFSAYDVFDDDKLNTLKRIADDEVPTAKIVDSLKDSLNAISSVERLIQSLQKAVQQIQTDLSIIIEPGVDTGIVIHVAFLIDGLIKHEKLRTFDDFATFAKIYRLEMDIVRTNLIGIERKYGVKIPEHEIAFITQMFIENKIKK